MPDTTPTPRFFKPNGTFHTAPTRRMNPIRRHMGVEIEVASGYSEAVGDAVRFWGGGIVPDDSLPPGGYEIVTAPASGDALAWQIWDVCHALHNAGAAVTPACGLHVHVDARDLGYAGIRRLLILYAKLELALFRLVHPRRMRGRFSVPCAKMADRLSPVVRSPRQIGAEVRAAVYGAGWTPSVRDKKYHPARYSALNVHSWFYRGTVEFRHHHGTIDADRIIWWAALCGAIVEASLRGEGEIRALPAKNGAAVMQWLGFPALAAEAA